MQNRITSLFNIKYPVIQGGMVWCSGWELASAVSNAGGLGLLGAGSMYPEILREHIRKCKLGTDKPFGVNIPLLCKDIETIMEIISAENVQIVFTSAGNPKTWTGWLQDKGIKVAHVVSSAKFAEKCELAGVDAVVAEGFEAGGHNGREETTTMVLIPAVREATGLPLISAGGIATGRGMLASFALGAEGVQIGSRFAITLESSAHQAFKDRCVEAGEGDTMLTLKKLIPTRLVKNKFFREVETLENTGASVEELRNLLGKGRARMGIFEGNLEEGEIEIGQICSLLKNIPSAGEVIKEIVEEFNRLSRTFSGYEF